MLQRAMLAAGGVLLGVAVLFGQAPIEERAVQVPETWGTAGGFTTVMGYELIREHYSALVVQPERTYCFEGESQSAAQEGLAHLLLPEGAALLSLQFWAYDEDPVYGLAFNVYEYCNGVGFNPPTTTLIGSGVTSGSSGYQLGSATLNGHRVNNRDCAYSVRVIFIPGNLQCVGEKLQVQKLQASWVRTVSPAPATATFSDVPTGHTFFQFVEALAKSGITGGCGNGNFCPGQPLTRGQMAVFLAKGLGLAWP